MKKSAIIEAAQAAERFICAVDKMNNRAEYDVHFMKFMGIGGFKETAAVRRASLDLTKLLAEMRKT